MAAFLPVRSLLASIAEKGLQSQAIKVSASVSANNVSSPKHVTQQQQIRKLSVHEHVSMSLLKDAGVPTPKFGVANTSAEARTIADELGGTDLVIKAQVLAGGRGKGHFAKYPKGGVQLLYNTDEIEEAAKGMIGDYLITKQTSAEGRICNSVMITERKYTRKEYYIAFMNERAFSGPVLIASSEGGVNIEDVAASNPDAIIKVPIDINEGFKLETAKDAANKIGIPAGRIDEVADILLNLYELFQSKDATMVEINPFAEDSHGDFFAWMLK